MSNWIIGSIPMAALAVPGGGGGSMLATGVVLPNSSSNVVVSPAVTDTAANDLDIRVDLTLADWSVGSKIIAAKTGGSGLLSWRCNLLSTGFLSIALSTTGSNTIFKNSTATVASAGVANGTRKVFRITVDIDNGSGGYNVAFYLADNINGPWTQLGSTVTTSGVLTRFASNSTPYLLGSETTSQTGQPGTYHRFQLFSNILDNGSGKVFDFDTSQVSYTAAQTPSFVTDSQGITWNVSGTAWSWTT